jgi:hypothetical protein
MLHTCFGAIQLPVLTVSSARISKPPCKKRTAANAKLASIARLEEDVRLSAFAAARLQSFAARRQTHL